MVIDLLFTIKSVSFSFKIFVIISIASKLSFAQNSFPPTLLKFFSNSCKYLSKLFTTFVFIAEARFLASSKSEYFDKPFATALSYLEILNLIVLRCFKSKATFSACFKNCFFIS